MPERLEAIAALRVLRMTAAEIAELLTMPLSTVAAIPAPVTVETVEMHLSNAYRNLGIHGRSELAAALGPAQSHARP